MKAFPTIPANRILNGIGGTIGQYDVIDEIAALHPGMEPAMDSFWIDFPGGRGWAFFWKAVDVVIAKCKARGVGANLGLVLLPQGTDQQIAAGAYAPELDLLAEKLGASGVNVLLRIGNELNVPGFGCTKGAFPEAFRRIAERLGSAHNVDHVWCVLPDASQPAVLPDGTLDPAWYPGDAHVDWLSLDLFNAASFAGMKPGQTPSGGASFQTFGVLTHATATGKPVLIGETSPIGYSIDATDAKGKLVYDEWLFPWFVFLANWLPTIRATSMIPVDWSTTGTFASWTNARIQDNPYLWSMWTAAMSFPKGTPFEGMGVGYMHRAEFMALAVS